MVGTGSGSTELPDARGGRRTPEQIEDLLGDEIERVCKAAYEPEEPEQEIGRRASYQAPPHQK
jgi:hypothetical protein